MVDLTEVLKGGPVSKMDTIEPIHIDDLYDDPRNFYKLEGLEELAANIELLGLQAPVRVRRHPDQPGKYIIVSGHRRRAAIRKLVESGRQDLAQIPCIVEQHTDSPALQELRLIYANSDTRKLTSAEVSKQVERVESLLYQLQEEGMEFPGRMRDHVAEACKVSRTKIARLKVIREKLDETWCALYEDGKLVESTAYAMAQLPTKYQAVIYEELSKKENGIRWMSASAVKTYGEQMAEVDQLICAQSVRASFPCGNREAKFHKIVQRGEYVYPRYCTSCCGKCPELAKCKYACPQLGAKIAKLKEEARNTRAAEKAAKKEKERPAVNRITQVWGRMKEARARAEVTVSQCLAAENIYISQDQVKNWQALEDGEKVVTAATELPFLHRCRLSDMESLIGLADQLGCSLDYLFCRTDVREMAVQTQQAAADGLHWISGQKPPADGERQLAVAVFKVDGAETPPVICEWDVVGWCFPNGGPELDGKCVKWYPIPPRYEKSKGDWRD